MKKILDYKLTDKVSKELIPTSFENAMNVYINVVVENKNYLLLFDINPLWETWFPYYDQNFKFTIMNLDLEEKDYSFADLIQEYENRYQKEFILKNNLTNESIMKTLEKNLASVFKVSNVKIEKIDDPHYELKYSKSKEKYTLYRFDNYVLTSVDDLNKIINNSLYETALLPYDLKETVHNKKVTKNFITYLKESNILAKFQNYILK